MRETHENRESFVTSVDMGEWKSLQTAGYLETKGVGLGVAVSIYYPGLALLGHFAAPADPYSRPKFDEMIKAAKTQIPDLSEARIWAGGGSPEMEEEAIELGAPTGLVKANRRLIEDTARELGIPEDSITTNWLDEEGYINYQLDVKSGRESAEIFLDRNNL